VTDFVTRLTGLKQLRQGSPMIERQGENVENREEKGALCRRKGRLLETRTGKNAFLL
jgi:hypothetical protein